MAELYVHRYQYSILNCAGGIELDALKKVMMTMQRILRSLPAMMTSV